MKKKVVILIMISLISFALSSAINETRALTATWTPSEASFYDFGIQDIDGDGLSQMNLTGQITGNGALIGSRNIKVYWNILSSQKVFVELSMERALQGSVSGSLDWIVLKDNKEILNSKQVDKLSSNLYVYDPAEKYDVVSDEVSLAVQTEDASNIPIGTYSGNLILNIVID